jgi:hypothetical protein
VGELPTNEYTKKGGILAAVITDKLRTGNGSKPSKVQGCAKKTLSSLGTCTLTLLAQ